MNGERSVEKPCAVADCPRVHYCRDWCERHYRRWRAHGDPNKVLVIQGDDVARFWTKVDKEGPSTGLVPGRCWVWTEGKTHDGYAQFSVNGRMKYAHRFSYKQEFGEIPSGLELDHLCRTRSCVRPGHLEPVTTRENLLRGETITAMNAAKTHCLRGHEFTEANTRITPNGRVCRECARLHALNYRRQAKAAREAA